ncbi:hypothetical protein [Treponema bryantii]|uniref:hypothetical protein n=1 Tax=Treponema bryantii TaxID=163 RepID=UPI002B29A3BC|nr:hypothetical protein TRBR_29870 [Treponema bryantii]
MNNKSPFYYCDTQFYKVMGYLENYLNQNFVEIDQEEWLLADKALRELKAKPENERTADNFYALLDDSVSFKPLIKELCAGGKYAFFEDNRKYVIKDMDELQFNMFDYYQNFLK